MPPRTRTTFATAESSAGRIDTYSFEGPWKISASTVRPLSWRTPASTATPRPAGCAEGSLQGDLAGDGNTNVQSNLIVGADEVRPGMTIDWTGHGHPEQQGLLGDRVPVLRQVHPAREQVLSETSVAMSIVVPADVQDNTWFTMSTYCKTSGPGVYKDEGTIAGTPVKNSVSIKDSCRGGGDPTTPPTTLAHHASGTTPPVTPPPTTPPTTPSTTPPAKPKTKKVTVAYQTDWWKLSTTKQGQMARKVVADGKYTSLREDVRWNARTGRVYEALLWARAVRKAESGTLTITVPANATSAQIQAAQKAALARKSGLTVGRTAVLAKAKTFVSVWLRPASSWARVRPGRSVLGPRLNWAVASANR